MLYRHYPLLMTAIGLALAAGALFTLMQPTNFRAEASFIVGQNGGVFQPGYGSATEPLARTLRSLIQSDTVVRAAADADDRRVTSDEIRRNLATNSRPDSGVVIVTYQAADAQTAVRVLTLVTDAVLAQVTVADSDPLRPGAAPPDPASVGLFGRPRRAEPVAPRALANIVVSLVAGVAIGVLLSIVFELVGRRRGAGPRSRPPTERAGRPGSSFDHGQVKP